MAEVHLSNGELFDAIVIGGAATPPTTTTTKPPVTTTAPGNGVATPQLTQPGMVTSRKKFHCVSEGNMCGQIISSNGTTLANFVKRIRAWAPPVKTCGQRPMSASVFEGREALPSRTPGS
ncbi:LysM domain-containing protein [Colletotrichum tabaci]|uniref:LysM domain-containing protein n=1 Tax=Colletotrichum tabaci TaxID=1209068 RepID=A0AAV9TBB9_9PEZI